MRIDAIAVAPQRIGELAEHAHALEARPRERERAAGGLVEALPVGEARAQEMRAEKAQLPAQHVRVRVDAGDAQAIEQQVPARRRADDDHAFLQAQPFGDELGQRIEEAALFLVELQRVFHAPNLGR